MKSRNTSQVWAYGMGIRYKTSHDINQKKFNGVRNCILNFFLLPQTWTIIWHVTDYKRKINWLTILHRPKNQIINA